MIKLEVNLPPTFALISIHRRYDDQWSVCVRRAHPSERAWGATAALGEHRDLAEAARLAIERCEAKIAAADREHDTVVRAARKASPLPSITLKL